mmetsp:Transcript_366/g.610  ORF Transcript_366/g.610 Transcript_366/m.610 type:complete len:337 (+) Transcript_366:119-1129(+)
MCKHGTVKKTEFPQQVRRLLPHQHLSFDNIIAMEQHVFPHDESYRRYKHLDGSPSPDRFGFGRDETGNLTHECIVERLNVMLWKENTIYNYDRFITTASTSADAAAKPPPHHDPMRRVNPEWRSQITKWSYGVVDHFHMSRECVAVSMNIFDRFFANEKEKASMNKVLLVSCAALSIGIKQMEVNELSLNALARFSRGKYTPAQIIDMEWKIVASLDFYLNPPTVISFVMHFILFLPHEINERDRNELVDFARFVTELSVADSFFVGNKPAPSVIAASAIIISLQRCTLSNSTLSTIIEIHYCDIILEQIGIDAADSRLKETLHRLQLLLKKNKRE